MKCPCPRLANDEDENEVVNQPDGESLDPGSIAMYKCKGGYRIYRGDQKRICQLNGTWTGQAAKCALIPGDIVDFIKFPYFTTFVLC